MTTEEDLKYPDEPSRFKASDLEKFVIWCTEQGTSDITFQSEDQVVCEIHGKKKRVTGRRLTHSEMTEIVSAIYKSDGAIARVNAQEDVPIPWSIKVSRDKILRFRVNITGVLVEGNDGIEITIRTISSRAPLLETLNLPDEIINNVFQKQGLVVIAGATGSGKSTLLASIIDWKLRDPESNLKIITYEAPIEYVYDDVPKPSSLISQSEIGKHLKSFSAGIRNALRRKPDVILVGEMRDAETIGEGITASMTGHLVYGTLHANGVADTVRRMVNVFPAEEKNSRAMDVLSSLKMVIGQMLVPSTDGKRVAIREYMVFTEDIVSNILDAGLENLTLETRKALKKHGKTFLDDATDKLLEGKISEKTFREIQKITKGYQLDEEVKNV